MNTTRIELNSGWRFKELKPRGNSEASDLDWMPAQVPGHVHLDLQREGVIGDPFYRMQERACAWVDETDWVYETAFQVENPSLHSYLRFNGLDTIAGIELNGEPLGQTDNMFIPHEFCVDGKLREGDNTLRIVFRSALRVGRERQAAWNETADGFAPHWFVWGPRSFVRKAQYMYGWDWGPELVSCGIWRPVELIQIPVARLLDWKYDVEFTDDNRALVTITAEVERAPGQEETSLTANALLRFIATPSGQSVHWSDVKDKLGVEPAEVIIPTGAGRVLAQVILNIPQPQRWYPNGQDGTDLRPATYSGILSIASSAEQKVATYTGTIARPGRVHSLHFRLGLRTIELIREPDVDKTGESFKFRINGQDVFMKGANWIPMDSFPARKQFRVIEEGCEPIDDRLSRLLKAARDAGFNMLRIWGGGLYESEEFYDLCDRLGILVWQDFPYGCAYYPDTGEYAEAVRHEATAAVRRIRNHPSLALWCGNNENHTMAHDHWEGKENPAPRYLGEHLYHEVLPGVVQAEDPKTPYIPSSPIGGENPNSQDYGDRHDWDVWHGVGDWKHYPEDDSRFLSEFGFASSCGLKAWDGCLAPSDRSPRSPVVRWHDKTRKGYETYLGYTALHFPEPQTLEDLVYYSQLNQAEALKCGIEHWRRRKGRCWGTLFWQINDCWPVQSWAVIDSELEPKAAYYAAKRFYAPILLSLVQRGDTVEAHLTNDLLEDVQGEVTLRVETFEGESILSETSDVYLRANETGVVATMEMAAMTPHAREVFVYAHFEPYGDAGATQGVQKIENLLLLAEPKDLRLSQPEILVVIEEDGGSGFLRGFQIRLTARRFAPYVWWRIEGVPGTSGQDNFFHLRAGETRRVIVSAHDLPGLKTVADVRARLIVRSL